MHDPGAFLATDTWAMVFLSVFLLGLGDKVGTDHRLDSVLEGFSNQSRPQISSIMEDSVLALCHGFSSCTSDPSLHAELSCDVGLQPSEQWLPVHGACCSEASQ